MTKEEAFGRFRGAVNAKDASLLKQTLKDVPAESWWSDFVQTLTRAERDWVISQLRD